MSSMVLTAKAERDWPEPIRERMSDPEVAVGIRRVYAEGLAKYGSDVVVVVLTEEDQSAVMALPRGPFIDGACAELPNVGGEMFAQAFALPAPPGVAWLAIIGGPWGVFAGRLIIASPGTDLGSDAGKGA